MCPGSPERRRAPRLFSRSVAILMTGLIAGGCASPAAPDRASSALGGTVEQSLAVKVSTEPSLTTSVGNDPIAVSGGRVELWADLVLDSRHATSYDVAVFVDAKLVPIVLDGPAELRPGDNRLRLTWPQPEAGADVRVVVRPNDPDGAFRDLTTVVRGVLEPGENSPPISAWCEVRDAEVAENESGFVGVQPADAIGGAAIILGSDVQGGHGALVVARVEHGRISEGVACISVEGTTPAQTFRFDFPTLRSGEYVALYFPSGDSALGEDLFLFGGDVSDTFRVP